MKKERQLGMLNIDTILYRTRISNKFTGRKPYKLPDPKLVPSFIPGTVLDILINPGQDVRKGDDLMILDAMKMQNKLICPIDGKVKAIKVNKGDRVAKGTILLEME
ncbi:MAG: acetyl-CoA carboxylase biotin carboxyl carrier protein subunit [Bacteroidales bacterium]|jgi:biotin carboxyl carrier protein